MSEPLSIVAGVFALVAVFGVLLRREDARLRRAAQRLRQLELEGVEELPGPHDPYPEMAAVEGGFLREPDGRRADTRRVLQEELGRARSYTRSLERGRSRPRGTRTRRRGTECLL